MNNFQHFLLYFIKKDTDIPHTCKHCRSDLQRISFHAFHSKRRHDCKPNGPSAQPGRTEDPFWRKSGDQDGQTAQGIWYTIAQETVGRPGGHSEGLWRGEKIAADFVREGEQWKIWHMRLYPINKSEYGTSWVDAVQPTPEDYTFASAEQGKGMWHYSPTEVYPANQPAIPYPYEKFEDVGITFMDEEG